MKNKIKILILFSIFIFSSSLTVAYVGDYVENYNKIIPENFNELAVKEKKDILNQLIDNLKNRIDVLIKKNTYNYFLDKKVFIDSDTFQKKNYALVKSEIENIKIEIDNKKNNNELDYDNYLNLVRDFEKRSSLVNEYLSQQNNVIPYYGSVRHAFWHSLIVDPQKAFKGKGAKGYHDYMVTVEETEKILDELYRRNWILVDYNDLYDFSDSSKIIKKQLYLPEGKKPLIISIDDVSYYHYMRGNGFLKKLVIDNDKEIVGEYVDNGSVEYLRNGDLMMVVDDFIYNHPDFSYNGAKGIIALTGYEGVLGYRTNTGNKELIREAKKIADRLKTLGWKFASHSYQHVEYKTLARFKKDMKRWINQVWPIIGDTNIFISPFGYRIPYNDSRMKYLNSIGFQIYCPVSAYDWTREHDNIIIMDRIDFDGIRMTKIVKFLKPFYDIENVYDNINRPVKI